MRRGFLRSRESPARERDDEARLFLPGAATEDQTVLSYEGKPPVFRSVPSGVFLIHISFSSLHMLFFLTVLGPGDTIRRIYEYQENLEKN